MPEETELTDTAPELVFDAATWENLPRHSSLLLYADGNFKAPVDAPKVLFAARVRYITVTGDFTRAGVLDWEPGNPCFYPGGVRSFVRGRRAASEVARVYCDRANAAESVAALRDFGNGDLLAYPGLVWHIATLDGHLPTAEELAADLAENWGAPEITEDRIWACQYATNGLYDTSVLFGKW